MELVVEFLIAYVLCVVHESCHLAVAKMLGLTVNRFSFWIWGMGMELSPVISPKKELLVSAAGPVFHIVMLPFLVGATQLREVNLAMLCVNLLPVLPLDGGRILRCIFLSRLPVRKADAICRRVSRCVCVILAIAVIWDIAEQKRGASLLCLIVFLVLSERRMANECSVRRMKRMVGWEKNDRQMGEAFFLSAHASVGLILRELYMEKENLFFILENGELRGLISERTALYEWGKRGSGTPCLPIV